MDPVSKVLFENATLVSKKAQIIHEKSSHTGQKVSKVEKRVAVGYNQPNADELMNEL